MIIQEIKETLRPFTDPMVTVDSTVESYCLELIVQKSINENEINDQL